MRRFYAPKENFQDKNIMLNLEETRHLRDVLRLRESETVQVFDGEDREFLCEIEKIGKRETVVKILKEILPPAPRSNLDLTLAAAILKGEKFDLVVQKAVELGVAKFVPVQTKRTDVKVKESEKKLERWRRIALEAAKQSGRAGLMKIETVIEFTEFIETAKGTKTLFAESGGAGFSKIEETKKITAVIGSEGGWENSEIEAARNSDFQIITFGGRILRAETAAIVIAGILQHRFGDLN
jgi:16S rRNA (uracil1498-N3)-methyltransferase